MKYQKLILFAFVLLGFFACQNETRIDPWEFRESGTANWLSATVPGLVHTDLLDHGLIPDPFVSTNELEIKSLEAKDWEYKTTFVLSSDLMKNEQVDLIFEGLDTYADVFLNDSLIIQADNMHRPWSAEVKRLLNRKENELRVQFYSPVRKGQEKLEELAYLIPNGNESVPLGKQNSVFSRKAQYHFGWDWGPRLVSSGIWREMKFKGWNKAKIENVKIDVKGLDENEAECVVLIEALNLSGSNLEAVVSFGDSQMNSNIILGGKDKIAYRVKISNPRIWWPNGMGEQALYDVKVDLVLDGKAVDSYITKFGLRTVKLIQNPDTFAVAEIPEERSPSSFYLEINGIPTFMKGANYIPADFFNNRARNKYDRVIQNALDANMNMLRVWGGAIYEDDAFYELCDEKGILIWQDFMFACAMVPTQKEHLENIRLEAKANVQRLHNHPSVVLWCGNNENLTGWQAWDWQNTYDLHGADSLAVWEAYDTLFNHSLKAIVTEHGNDIYWPSSPTSATNSRENKWSGDQHEWGIWFGQKYFDHYKENAGRFISEFGLQSFPSMSTIQKMDTSITNWELETLSLNFRQRSKMNWIKEGFDGFDMMRHYIDYYYPEPKGLEDFVYLSQLTQADGLQVAIESHRRNKPYTMGSLYWQIDDVWPTISWSTVDYYGNWKAAHYAVREANKEMIISVNVEGNQLDVHLVSDRLTEFNGKLKLELKTLSGAFVQDIDLIDCWVGKLGNKIIYSTELAKFLKGKKPSDVFLTMALMDGSKVIDQGLHYFAKPREMQLKDPSIHTEIIGNRVKLSCNHLAKGVYLSVLDTESHFSDNYFDLLPGETKEVILERTSDEIDLGTSLKVESLWDLVK